jgi:hypothetical protein
MGITRSWDSHLSIGKVEEQGHIALLSENITSATELLIWVELAAANIGLFINVCKLKSTL